MDHFPDQRMGKQVESEEAMEHYQLLEHLSEYYGPAYYIFHEDVFEQNVQEMRRAFLSRYPRLIMGYSYKTNYLPYLCKKADELGAYAEVVSRLEYQLAQKLDVDPQRIIFNGPLKSRGDLARALQNESIVNLDSFAEIGHVRQYCREHPHKLVKVGLRISMDLSEKGVSLLQNGYEVSRFGFSVENGSFLSAVKELKSIPQVQIAGLHGHFSTNRSTSVYEKIAQMLCVLAREHLGDELEYIDIGGGFYGPMPSALGFGHVPSFDDYAKTITQVLKRELVAYGLTPVLVIEPGVSLVANTFEFVCKVADVKHGNGRTFVFVEGSVHNVKPTMHNRLLAHRVVTREQNHEQGRYSVVGYTCMEKDYLLENAEGPMPRPGDYIVFESVGAYTIVFQPPFIRERPPVFGRSGDRYMVLRAKETFEEFFSAQMYSFHSTPYLEI